MDDTMRKSILIYSVKERDDLVKKADSLEFDIDTLKEELKLSEERTEVYKKMSIAKTKELEIKNKEAQDLMSVTKPPHSVLKDEESIPQLEKKHNVDLPMDDEKTFNVDEDSAMVRGYTKWCRTIQNNPSENSVCNTYFKIDTAYTKDFIDYEAVVKLSEDFNGADLRNVCTEAGMFAIRNERDYVMNEDFMKAVRKVGDNKKLETKMDYKQV